MRLWHQDLIPKLPRQQLLGQHRECCALRGKGWGRKHSVVDYVFTYHYYRLFNYHRLIIYQMIQRGYKIEPKWTKCSYRGKQIGFDESEFTKQSIYNSFRIYPEHNQDYLKECVENLRLKGIKID